MSNVKIYIQPTIHDIKPNGGNHSHPGNKRYIEIIRKRKLDYVMALDPKKKTEVITDVYNALLPGRFLKSEKGGKYSIKDKSSSLAKIKKALSENNAKIIESLKFRGKWPPRKKYPNKGIPVNETKPFKQIKKKLPKKVDITRKDWILLAESLKR